jgi:hypothetical protein
MKTNIRYAMAIMAAAFLYLVAITFLPVTETGNEHAKTIVGFLLGTAFSTLINYYWGNSKTKQPDPEFPAMDEAVKAGTDKLQAKQIEAVKIEGEKN